MPRPYAFSSTAQVVLDWWDAWKAGLAAHEEALARIAPELAPWEGAKPAVTGAFGHYSFDGFMRDWHRPVPEGWKACGPDKKWIQPKRGTREGKAIVARMKEVPPYSDPRYSPGIPGVKLDLIASQPAIGVRSGVAWMTWGDNWDRLSIVDQEIWTVRRMSEYYAALEAEKENHDA